MKAEHRAEALKLIKQLIKLNPEGGVMAVAAQMHGMITLPMATVLDKVPGMSVVEQARLVGVSRQAWYAWKRGESRPNPQQAKRLEELTGFPADAIRGRAGLPPPRAAAASPRAAR